MLAGAVEEAETPGLQVSVQGSWSMPEATPEDVQRVKQELLRRYAQRMGQAIPPAGDSPAAVAGPASKPRPGQLPQTAQDQGKQQAVSEPPAVRLAVSVTKEATKKEAAKRPGLQASQPGEESPLGPSPPERAAPRVVPLAGPLSRLKLLAVAEDAQGRQLALLDDGTRRFTLGRGDRLLEPRPQQGASGLLWHVEAIGPGTVQLRQDNTQRRLLLR